MIVKMAKVYVVTRGGDRDRLLARVRDLGVVHLAPIDPARVIADEATAAEIADMQRAIQVLSSITPAGETPNISAGEATRAVLDIQRHSAERGHHLAALHRQIEQLAPWGDLELKQFEALREAGIEVRFFSVPSETVPEIQAECAEVVGALPGQRSLVAVIDRRGEPALPDRSEPVPLPQRDAASVRAEAAEIDAAIKRDARRLAELAHLTGRMETDLTELRQKADYKLALHGALDREPLFAIQGWVPAEISASLTPQLADAGIEAAVQVSEPAPDDEPPTLVRCPGWARPIEGLFNVLGSVASYREFDISIPFMIALPIFAAMLISDGGYGAILLLAPLLLYARAARSLGARFTQLVMVVGAVAMVWGLLCGSFFGYVAYTPLIPVDLSDRSRSMLMEICFTLGAVHLSVAQLWQAVSLFPNLRFLNKVGWAAFIWGMLGVVRMFVLQTPVDWSTPWPYLLLAGAVLAILFRHPSWNIPKMLGLGIADCPLSVLSAFSDLISYVRLMAVGLASSVLSANFNELALGIKFWPVTILVLLFGHGLNLGLALIALFAHGVRLNMLEFSNNLGMQWAGYPYRPFLKRTIQEH